MRHPPRSVLLTDAGAAAPGGTATVPALRVLGNELVAADGTARRPLDAIAWPNDPSRWPAYEITDPARASLVTLRALDG